MPLEGIGNTHSQLIVHQATFDKAGSNLSQFNSSSEDLAISLLESFRKMPNGDNRALVLNTRADLVRLQAHVTQHGESLKRVRQKHQDLIEKHEKARFIKFSTTDWKKQSEILADIAKSFDQEFDVANLKLQDFAKVLPNTTLPKP